MSVGSNLVLWNAGGPQQIPSNSIVVSLSSLDRQAVQDAGSMPIELGVDFHLTREHKDVIVNLLTRLCVQHSVISIVTEPADAIVRELADAVHENLRHFGRGLINGHSHLHR